MEDDTAGTTTAGKVRAGIGAVMLGVRASAGAAVGVGTGGTIVVGTVADPTMLFGRITALLGRIMVSFTVGSRLFTDQWVFTGL
jgi:hypothetical protein